MSSSRGRESKDKKFHRDLLRAREKSVDLSNKVGKTELVSSVLPLHMQGGFFCQVCKCMLKDSMSYLDHINGRKHLHNMEMCTKIEHVTRDRVRDRLQLHKRRREGVEKDTSISSGLRGDSEEDILSSSDIQRQKGVDEEEDVSFSFPAKKKGKSSSTPEGTSHDEKDKEKTSIMGFPMEFGSSKQRR